MVDRFEVDTPVQRLATIIGDAGPIGGVVTAANNVAHPTPRPDRGLGISGPGGMA